jgi:hypothetical protein
MRHAPLATLGLCLALLGAAGPARAAADLASVTLTISVVRVENAVKGVTASIEVVGDRITRASITPPRGALVEIPAGGAGFLLEKTFTTEAELTTAFPDGTYVLTLNGTTDYDLPLTRAPVPSPAISAPVGAAVLVPGPVTVSFTPCSICDQDLDSTTGTLLDGDGAEIENSGDTLGPNDDRWSPLTELPENAAFTAVVLHALVRADHLTGPGNDAFDLVGSFSQEDSVPFFTGAAVPSGEFCLVVEDDAQHTLDPTGECAAAGDENAALFDPSGTFSLPIGGLDMAYTSEVLPSGEIVGSAFADLDGNGSMESATPLHGKVTGSAGKVQRKLSFKFKTESPSAKLRVKIGEDGLVTEGSLAGEQTAKGTVEGVRIDDSVPSTLPLGEAPLGWLLHVSFDDKHHAHGSVTILGRPEIPLDGRWQFDFVTGFTEIDLDSVGADAGIHVRFGQLVIDTTDPAAPTISQGHLRYDLFGQGGRIELP